MILLLQVLGWSVEPPWIGRDALRAVQGPEKTIANELLQAAEKRDVERIRLTIAKAVGLGHWELVAMVAKYPFDPAKREAARALANLKGTAIAQRLLEGWDLLDFATMGGDQQDVDRAETRQAFEAALTKVTGVNVDPQWTKEQKRAAFVAWVAANQVLPEPTHPPATQASVNPQSSTLAPETRVPVTIPTASPQPATPVAQTPAVPAEHRAPVWPWLVGIAAFVVIIAVALKRRA